MATITVASIEQKPKRSVVITTEGRRLGCFNEKIAKFEIEQGGTYNVETTEVDANGATLTNIVSAKRVTIGIPVPQTTSAASTPAANGNGHGNGHGSYRETSDRDAERMWVCATLTALIRAGEVKNDKRQLWETTNMLRALWSHSFGNGGTFQTSDAGKVRLVAAE